MSMIFVYDLLDLSCKNWVGSNSSNS